MPKSGLMGMLYKPHSVLFFHKLVMEKCLLFDHATNYPVSERGMDNNYTKKTSKAPGAFNRRSTSRYDPNAPTSLEMTKQSELLPLKSPEASMLSVVLASYYDGSSHSGVISPAPERVMGQLNWTDEQFAEALAELVKSGYWDVPMDSESMLGGIDFSQAEVHEIKDILLAYDVRRLQTYICRFVDLARENKRRLQQQKVSFNHLRCLSRYTGQTGGLATAMQLMAVARMAPTFNDLGYSWFRKQGIEPVHVMGTPPRKLCHSVLFNHPMMRAGNPAEWEYLASIRNLTEDMVTNPKTAVIKAQDIAKRFNLEADTAWRRIWAAVGEIRSTGWFTVKVFTHNPFLNGMDATLQFTPTKKLHDLVWSYDLQAGGRAQTQWEINHGFLSTSKSQEGEDPMVSLPKAGYHWLYLLKRKKTGAYLTAGQTTMALQTRLFQHRTEGSNADVDAVIREINADPNDALLIEAIGQVHYWSTAEMEMRALWKMQELGHRMFNKIDTVAENRRTIKLDTRLAHMGEAQLEEFLRKQWEVHGGTIFQNQLPLPDMPPNTSDEPLEDPRIE